MIGVIGIIVGLKAHFLVFLFSSYFLFVSGDIIPAAEKSKQLPAHLQKHLRDRLLIDPEVRHSMQYEYGSMTIWTEPHYVTFNLVLFWKFLTLLFFPALPIGADNKTI